MRRRIADVEQFNANRPRKVQNDMKVLRSIYTCMRFTGMAPFSLQPNVCYKLMFFALYLSMLAQIYYCVSIWSTIITDVSTDLLYKLTFALNLPFAALCSTFANFRTSHWKKLTASIWNLERLVLECGFEYRTKLGLVYAQSFFIFIFFSVEQTIYINLRNEEGVWSRVKQTAVWSMFYFYRVLMMVYLPTVTRLLQRRYLHILGMLSKEDCLVENLAKAMKIVKRIREAMVNVSQIFGLHLFFCVAIYMLALLGVISNVIVSGDVRYSGIYFLPGSILSLVVLVMSCDSLEKSGKKIIKTCYTLHESVGNELIKEELFLLATYAEQWKPSLSAAGFYDLNQTTLSTLFEAIITYLVIIIQFNLALV